MSHPNTFLKLVDGQPKNKGETQYRATLMAYGEGGENTFEFIGPPQLMEQPADEVVDAFINYINGQGITEVPFRY